MSFQAFLENQFTTACELQRKIEQDTPMVNMVRDGLKDDSLVKKWMRTYGLFQGVSRKEEDAIARRFLNYVESHTKVAQLSENEIRNIFSELLSELFQEVARTWISATSKLLWCLYPDEIVIYDSFVHRTLTVMQCIDTDLAEYPRIGETPTINNEQDIVPATHHYMNYQAMVQKLLRTHAQTIAELRLQNDESYPYDIRIMDKLLWMIGNPKARY
jgi:hypothetical protein